MSVPVLRHPCDLCGAVGLLPSVHPNLVFCVGCERRFYREIEDEDGRRFITAVRFGAGAVEPRDGETAGQAEFRWKNSWVESVAIARYAATVSAGSPSTPEP